MSNFKMISVYTDGKGEEKEYGGCGYYRIVQPSKFTGIPYRKDFWSSFYTTVEEQVTELWNQYDLCLMGRIEQPMFVSGLICSRFLNEQLGKTKKLIIDMDDDFLNVHDDNDAKRVYQEGTPYQKAIKVLLTEADGLVVSTDKLAELYSQFNTNIEVFENLVDQDLWNIDNAVKDDGKIRIGWTGGMSHHADLEWFTPVVEAITKKYPNVIFSILGYQPVEWAKYKIERGFPVPFKKYPEALAAQGYDIGIAPLANTEFNMAKSAIKYYEYSMLSIPSVCQKSKILPYENKGVEGESILTAGTVEEWIEVLSKLIESEKLRNLIGTGAYRHVKRYFSADRDSSRRTEFYRATYAGERKNANIGTRFGI